MLAIVIPTSSFLFIIIFFTLVLVDFFTDSVNIPVWTFCKVYSVLLKFAFSVYFCYLMLCHCWLSEMSQLSLSWQIGSSIILILIFVTPSGGELLEKIKQSKTVLILDILLYTNVCQGSVIVVV